MMECYREAVLLASQTKHSAAGPSAPRREVSLSSEQMRVTGAPYLTEPR